MDKGWKTRFFMIWAGQAFSLFGSSLVSFALIWWLTEKTGSETILSLATLTSTMPAMVIGPFAGTLVDRFSRRKVMILSDGSIAVATALLLIAFALNVEQVWMIFVIMFVRSVGGAFHQVAMRAATTMMAPEDWYSRIGGMNRGVSGAMGIVAPVLGAMMISFFDMESILIVDMVTAALAIGVLAAIRIAEPKEKTEKSSLWKEMLMGVEYIKGAKNICFVVLTCTSANIFYGCINAFRPMLIMENYGGGAVELGYVGSACGLGVLVGGLIMSVWKGFDRKLITSAFGWIGLGVCLVGSVALPGNMFWGALICFFGFSLFCSVGNSPMEAFYQTYVPPEMQGRLFAIINTLDQMTMPLGLLISAAVGDRAPIAIWFILPGLSHVVLGAAWMFSRRIREAEEVVPPSAAQD